MDAAALDQTYRRVIAEERARELRRPGTYALGLLPLALGVVGIAVGVPIMAIVGLIAAIAVPFSTARRRAQQRADALVLAEWATGEGLVYDPTHRPPPEPRTAILRHGDRREVRGSFAGTGPDGRPFEILNLWTETTSGSGKNRSTRTDWFAVLRVEQPLQGLAELRLHRRTPGTGIFDALDAAITDDRTVELESVELDQAWRIEVDDAADDAVVRTIFTPARIVELVEKRASIPEIDYGHGFWTTHVSGQITWGSVEEVSRLRAVQAPIADLLEPAQTRA